MDKEERQMAEMAALSLIDRLVPLLTKEVKLLGGIYGEVADIIDELESIQSFLKDADARAAAEEYMSEGVKTWVKQVREVTVRIDIAIDQYLLLMAQHPRRHGFFGFLHKTTHLLKTLKPRHKIAAEIQEIKASLQKIKERSERYRFQSTSQGSSSNARTVRWNDPRKDSLYLDDANVVGIESPRDELIGWLVEGSSHCTVVSVVGMGGLGKTTLVKKVYDHQTVQGHFDCHAWVSVSQSYNVEDMLRSMIKQFCKARMESPVAGIETMDEASLINELREYIQQKRYVVIFDDVWKVDFWEDIKHALLNNNKGGRIMITTRNMEVAIFCKKSSPIRVFKLQPLSRDKAWELFCKRTFQFDFEGYCPQELQNLSVDIVEKCKGLPLAIIAIGGLLSTKDKTIFEWKKLLDNLGFELRRDRNLEAINKILSFSYEDLPHSLKSCFLYLGMYPKDYSINCVRLIRQWIAEGFVKETLGKTLEEVAQEYLIELIHRSMIQVSQIDFVGRVRQCQLHDLLHEIVLQKIKDLRFCHVFSKQQSIFEGQTRRMSVDRVSYNDLRGFKVTSIHSLLMFNIYEFPTSFFSTLVVDFKLLKVMDFEGAPLDHIPKDIGSLFHLRYLSLRKTKVNMLPRSIGKLQNLETLDLKQSLVYDIPMEINKLSKLRHLLAYYWDDRKGYSLTVVRGVKIQKGVGCLKDLQKLNHVEVNHGGIDLITELENLKQLRKLGVTNLTRETGWALCASVEKMNHLESLDLTSISEDEIIDLQFISSPPQCLRRLYIKGHLDKLPDWIPKVEHLTTLRIRFSRLSDDPLKVLQDLHNLLELEISNHAYSGEQLHFKIGGFPKLKFLRLRHLDNLNSLIIDEGGLPILVTLWVGPCPKLKEVPFGIQHLRDLKALLFRGIPKELEESLDPGHGPHYWIIEHVPIVNISCKVDTGNYDYDSRILDPIIWRGRSTTMTT